MNPARTLVTLAGRLLLGLYFIFPAVMKISNFSGTSEYMASHGMALIPFLLVLTIAVQLAGGLSLIVGYRLQIVAFLLAGLVLAISIVLHDFWTLDEGLQRAHETQNFVKNMGIMAGLLILAGGHTPNELQFLNRSR